MELFTIEQIDKLQAEFGSLKTIDPSQPTYRKLIRLLNSLSLGQLRQLRDANIKFVSKLAVNRLPQ